MSAIRNTLTANKGDPVCMDIDGQTDIPETSRLKEAERARIQSLRSHAVLDTPREALFDRFVFTVAQLFRAPIAQLSFIDEDRQWIKAQVGLSAGQVPRTDSVCAHTILSDEALIIEDTTADARSFDNPLVLHAPFVRFYAGAPLIAANGYRIGALCVMDTRPRTPGDRQILHLKQLANSVMQSVIDDKDQRRAASWANIPT